jgi:hypothetical protein
LGIGVGAAPIALAALARVFDKKAFQGSQVPPKAGPALVYVVGTRTDCIHPMRATDVEAEAR